MPPSDRLQWALELRDALRAELQSADRVLKATNRFTTPEQTEYQRGVAHGLDKALAIVLRQLDGGRR